MVQAYFDNIEEKLSAHIAKAGRRIYIAVAWFTNEALFNDLLNALQKNVEVKVLLLDDILNRNEFGLDFGMLVNKGADVRFATSNKGTMHNKFCVIDNVVITGSYNWTYHANVNNENIVITDELNIVNSYCEQFETLFNVCDPIKLPYEHLKWTEVKEEDFTELRRNIYKDVKAQNDVNSALRQQKLKRLNDAYKSGSAEELAKAGSLPIAERFRTIVDVLTGGHDYVSDLWSTNNMDAPYQNETGFNSTCDWMFKPLELKTDKHQHEYIRGVLRTYESIIKRRFGSDIFTIDIYDVRFIDSIKRFIGNEELCNNSYKKIPKEILCIPSAQMFFYEFPTELSYKNTNKPHKSINVFGIAKEVDGDKVVFYEGWDPQKRGEKIMNECFAQNSSLQNLRQNKCTTVKLMNPNVSYTDRCGTYRVEDAEIIKGSGKNEYVRLSLRRVLKSGRFALGFSHYFNIFNHSIVEELKKFGVTEKGTNLKAWREAYDNEQTDMPCEFYGFFWTQEFGGIYKKKETGKNASDKLVFIPCEKDTGLPLHEFVLTASELQEILKGYKLDTTEKVAID